MNYIAHAQRTGRPFRRWRVTIREDLNYRNTNGLIVGYGKVVAERRTFTGAGAFRVAKQELFKRIKIEQRISHAIEISKPEETT